VIFYKFWHCVILCNIVNFWKICIHNANVPNSLAAMRIDLCGFEIGKSVNVYHLLRDEIA